MTRTQPRPPERASLPLDASDLPSLGDDAARTLVQGLADMGLLLPDDVLAGIDAHARLLAAWGRHINLTAIRDPVEVVRLHVLDSLAAVAPIQARLGQVGAMVDIGSGGGYPGIPLALALRAARLTLVESVTRKARFLEVAGAAAAGLADEQRPVVEVAPVRAESLAEGERRGTWDLATVRAVGTVAECAELGLPLLRVGGLLVCWKREPALPGEAPRGGTGREVIAARGLIDRLGGDEPEVVPAHVPGAPAHQLVLVRKARPTHDGYPRPPAVRRGPVQAPSPGPHGGRRRS